jgi:hypothetical protein
MRFIMATAAAMTLAVTPLVAADNEPAHSDSTNQQPCSQRSWRRQIKAFRWSFSRKLIAS